MAKHVIFLGAGASVTSGYPLAADLRKIFSSTYSFGNHLREKIGQIDKPLTISLAKWFSRLSSPIELFREGGFGTVDEFSFLAGKRFPQEVHEIKQLVGLVFALHNPEKSYKTADGQPTNGFESSDYYPLIQRLFRESDEIRDDIAILSYNYDPYFEFLLNRAYIRRKQATIKNQIVIPPTEFTSGFMDRDAKAITERKGFCLLKLHGTSVLPPPPTKVAGFEDGFLTFDEVFWEQDKLLNSQNDWSVKTNPSPAMYFPWELLDDKDNFVGQDRFADSESLAANFYFQHIGRTLYELCKAIWQRARREIAEADKISFVGLSMHEFLKPGLRFLFKERLRKFEESPTKDLDWQLEIILACPGAWSSGETFRSLPRPNSPAAKLASILSEVNPGMAKKEKGQIYSRNSGKKSVGGVICYDSFKDFIEAEL